MASTRAHRTTAAALIYAITVFFPLITQKSSPVTKGISDTTRHLTSVNQIVLNHTTAYNNLINECVHESESEPATMPPALVNALVNEKIGNNLPEFNNKVFAVATVSNNNRKKFVAFARDGDKEQTLRVISIVWHASHVVYMALRYMFKKVTHILGNNAVSQSISQALSMFMFHLFTLLFSAVKQAIKARANGKEPNNAKTAPRLSNINVTPAWPRNVTIDDIGALVLTLMVMRRMLASNLKALKDDHIQKEDAALAMMQAAVIANQDHKFNVRDRWLRAVDDLTLILSKQREVYVQGDKQLQQQKKLIERAVEIHESLMRMPSTKIVDLSQEFQIMMRDLFSEARLIERMQNAWTITKAVGQAQKNGAKSAKTRPTVPFPIDAPANANLNRNNANALRPERRHSANS